jgi:DNA (cytosine-5)-methyltransferase 1
LESADFDLLLGVELWTPARNVYQDNFDHPVRALDLSDTNAATAVVRRQRPDIVVGGPPCQDFSAAGGRVEGDKARLTEKFARIVCGSGAGWFLLENVMGIQNSETWAKSRRILQRAGYGITECVLNAAYFGVPQHRKRFFAIGCQGEDDGFLADALAEGASEEPMTVRDYVGDAFGIDYYYRHPRTWGRRAVFSLDEPSPTVRSTNRPVPPGYRAHRDDSASHRRARPLTAPERARVQTFGADFRFQGTITDQDVMIANAVPVNLARHVGATILEHQQRRALMPGDQRFRTWLAETQVYTPRTVSNVLSRLKRAGRLLNTAKLAADPLDVIHALERRKEFVALPVAVRSQIKKAVRLHAEFRRR